MVTGSLGEVMDADPPARPVDLIYGLNEWPPLQLGLLATLQHVLPVFVGIVTPPLLISRALKLSASLAAGLEAVGRVWFPSQGALKGEASRE